LPGLPVHLIIAFLKIYEIPQLPDILEVIDFLKRS
jgi:hypothetical protein